MEDKHFVGIVIGGDMNSYAVARAFYEAYQIKTIILARIPVFPCRASNIIEGHYYDNLLNEEVLLGALSDLDRKYPDKKKIILGNTDHYVREIIYAKDKIERLSDNFIVPTCEREMFDKLFEKDSFYELCAKYGLEYPKTVSFDLASDNEEKYKIPFDYPIFLKPVNADTFIALSGVQKGYKIKSNQEFKKIIKNIKELGYKDRMIIQEYIQSSDEDMYVFTLYANRFGKVEKCTAGNILMHDRTPALIGNYNAIKNAYNEEISKKLKSFVEKIKFVGICHFDIAYDRKRNRYVVFEMNIRQGRSNLYTLASGVNLAECLVDDYIYKKEKNFEIADKEFVVSVVSKKCLKECTKLKEIKNFYRFGLAPYDLNLLRYYFQYRWDKKVLESYKEYN